MLVPGHAWRAQKRDFVELNEDRGSCSPLECLQALRPSWLRPSGVLPVAAHAAQFEDSVLVMACISLISVRPMPLGWAEAQLDLAMVEQ